MRLAASRIEEIEGPSRGLGLDLGCISRDRTVPIGVSGAALVAIQRLRGSKNLAVAVPSSLWLLMASSSVTLGGIVRPLIPVGADRNPS